MKNKICNCKNLEDIDLVYIQNGQMIYEVKLNDEEDGLDYEEYEFSSDESGDFFCRSCLSDVNVDFNNEGKIIKFLKKLEKSRN
jgi:hypothetical protein